jgi:peptidyl-prolyl cis-trans isomerase A (cyclophilin A)
MVAEYSTCPKVAVGDARSVGWAITSDAKNPAIALLAEKGGGKGEPAKYTGTTTPAGLQLRAGKTAGLDLVESGGQLAGRHVASREGGCVVIYTVTAERATDQPFDVGTTDPDAATWGLEQALAGLPPGQRLYADLVTEAGTITCELYADRAPIAVANFVGLARGLRAWRDPASRRWIRYRPYYDGLAFHRVIPGFVIQAGDPLSRDWADSNIGTGGPGYTIADEQTGVRFDQPGRLAMANRGPNTGTGGSQFFISETKLGHLDGGYTIFGQCGPMDVVKVIARVPANAQSGKPDLPLIIKTITIRR